MNICPYDCTVCIKPNCRADGCERTGEKMMETCEDCGALFIAVHYSTFCAMCIKSER